MPKKRFFEKMLKKVEKHGFSLILPRVDLALVSEALLECVKIFWCFCQPPQTTRVHVCWVTNQHILEPSSNLQSRLVSTRLRSSQPVVFLKEIVQEFRLDIPPKQWIFQIFKPFCFSTYVSQNKFTCHEK